MKFRHKIAKWLHDGGKESLEVWCYIFYFLVTILFMSFIASLLKNIPLICSELVSKLLESVP